MGTWPVLEGCSQGIRRVLERVLEGYGMGQLKVVRMALEGYEKSLELYWTGYSTCMGSVPDGYLKCIRKGHIWVLEVC